MTTNTPGVETRIDDGIAVLRLNRPQDRNAMTESLREGVSAALADLAVLDEVRVLVVTGAGEAFSAGGDLALMTELPKMPPEESAERLADIYSAFLKLLAFPVPTIAAVNGPAVGGGLGIAALCDIRIASESAMFSAPFGQIGLPPGMGLTVTLPEILGYAKAIELLLTGSSVDAAEALRIGLVSEVVSDLELAATARSWAERIAQQSSAVNQAIVDRLRGDLRRRVDEAIEHEVLCQSMAVGSTDYEVRLKMLTDRMAK